MINFLFFVIFWCWSIFADELHSQCEAKKSEIQEIAEFQSVRNIVDKFMLLYSENLKKIGPNQNSLQKCINEEKISPEIVKIKDQPYLSFEILKKTLEDFNTEDQLTLSIFFVGLTEAVGQKENEQVCVMKVFKNRFVHSDKNKKEKNQKLNKQNKYKNSEIESKDAKKVISQLSQIKTPSTLLFAQGQFSPFQNKLNENQIPGWHKIFCKYRDKEYESILKTTQKFMNDQYKLNQAAENALYFYRDKPPVFLKKLPKVEMSVDGKKCVKHRFAKELKN